MDNNLEFILRLLLAGILGAVIGLERKVRFKDAGLRTHFVLAVGAAMFMIVSKYGFFDVTHLTGVSYDPSRVVAQVVTGVGFLGAGTIIFQRHAVRGLTTAAGLWTTAGIGVAIGAGLYVVGIIGTVLVLVGFTLLKRIERHFIGSIRHVVITAADEPGLIGRIGVALGGVGVNIERVELDRSEQEAEYVEIEVSLRAHQQALDMLAISEALASIPGIRQVEFGSRNE